MNCTSCGRALSGEERFCTNCGAPATKPITPPRERVPESPPPPVGAARSAETEPLLPALEKTTPPAARPRSGAPLMAGLLVLLLLATGGVAWYAYRALGYSANNPVLKPPPAGERIRGGNASAAPAPAEEYSAPPPQQRDLDSEPAAGPADSSTVPTKPQPPRSAPSAGLRPPPAPGVKAATPVAPISTASTPIQPETPGSSLAQPSGPAPDDVLPAAQPLAPATSPSPLGSADPGPEGLPLPPAPQHVKRSDAPPPPKRAPGRILRPGEGSLDPAPAAPIREERQEAVVEPSGPAGTPPAARAHGDLYWTGVLDKNTIVSVDSGAASAGAVSGAALPGKPVQIEAFSPAIEIVQQPGADSGWTQFRFRCLRNSKASATVNFRWRLQ